MFWWAFNSFCHRRLWYGIAHFFNFPITYLISIFFCFISLYLYLACSHPYPFNVIVAAAYIYRPSTLKIRVIAECRFECMLGHLISYMNGYDYRTLNIWIGSVFELSGRLYFIDVYSDDILRREKDAYKKLLYKLKVEDIGNCT